MALTTITEQLQAAMKYTHDTTPLNMVECLVFERTDWRAAPVVEHTPYWTTGDKLPTNQYDPGYGLEEGPGIVAYTTDFVYTKHEYDGSEWVAGTPRTPQAASTHYGVAR